MSNLSPETLIVYAFLNEHTPGSICDDNCPICTEDGCDSTMTLPGEPHRWVPAQPLYIVRAATRQEYNESCRAFGEDPYAIDKDPLNWEYFYVVSTD